jgi:hypothetical protein
MVSSRCAEGVAVERLVKALDKLIGNVHNGSRPDCRLWRYRLRPDDAPPIDDDLVPDNRFLAGFAHGFREQPVLVPILSGTPVGDPSKSHRGRSPPVSRQYGLPHDEYPDVLTRFLLQNLVYCGGPPQTIRSSRRKQRHNANGILCLIKRAPQLTEVRRI